MAGRLKTILGPREREATLAARLRQYPPFVLPHPGSGDELSDDQARGNLANWLQQREQRLATITRLLHDDAGLDTAPALAAPRQHAAALCRALQQWATQAWPALPPHPRPAYSHWLHSRRDGDGLVYSMLADLALLLGELVCRGNPVWRWGVDLDPQNVADGLLTARRIVLLADVGGHRFVLDVEAVVVARYLDAEAPAQRLLDPLRQLVERGLRGDDFGVLGDSG